MKKRRFTEAVENRILLEFAEKSGVKVEVKVEKKEKKVKGGSCRRVDKWKKEKAKRDKEMAEISFLFHNFPMVLFR